MPTSEAIQQYLTGAWRLMRGQSDGLDLLDISSDGFWNSFFAIVLVLPVFGVNWVTLANELAAAGDSLGWRFGIVLRLAVADILAWILPIVLLAAAAGPLGISDRFVPYVIASNWGSVITGWLMLPPALMELVGVGGSNAVGLTAIALFGLALILTWRLTDSSVQRGWTTTAMVFFGMLFTAIFVLYSTQSILGVLPPVAQAPG